MTVQVSGAKLGHTKITATSVYGDMNVSSNPAPIQVFPPLKDHHAGHWSNFSGQFLMDFYQNFNNYMFLAGVGSRRSLGRLNCLLGYRRGGWCGGERPHHWSQAGRLLRGGQGSEPGWGVGYSQDMVLVHVVPLSAMRIASAVKRLVVGTAMPLYLVGSDGGAGCYRLEII